MITTLLAGLVAIGILILVHEAGHFVAAKIFRVGVPVFSIGMGPRIFGFRWDHTDFRISALPIGGYVQLEGADPFGEEDASVDIPPERDFMRKPVWQRLIIMAAGPAVNLVLPVAVFTVLLMLGRPELGTTVGLVLDGSPAQEAGFRIDDTIVAVDDTEVETWWELREPLEPHVTGEQPVRFAIEREGRPLTLEVPASAVAHDVRGRVDFLALGLQSTYLSSRVGVEAEGSPAWRAGVRTGDRVMAVDGTPVETWQTMLAALGEGGAHELTVERWPDEEDPEAEAETLTLRMDLDQPYVPAHDVYANAWGFAPVGLFARKTDPTLPAAQAGILPGDRLLSIDGAPIRSWDEFVSVVSTSDGGTGEPPELALTMIRDGRPVDLTLTPAFTLSKGDPYKRPLIGVWSWSGSRTWTDFVSKQYGFLEAVPRAADETWTLLKAFSNLLGLMATLEASPLDNMGGPVRIFHQAGQAASAGAFVFAGFIGMLSLSLGLVNLLPIPVLDGGQILFYAVEWVRGRPLSLELRERFQIIGVVAMIILFVVITANDIKDAVGL